MLVRDVAFVEIDTCALMITLRFFRKRDDSACTVAVNSIDAKIRIARSSSVKNEKFAEKIGKVLLFCQFS